MNNVELKRWLILGLVVFLLFVAVVWIDLSNNDTIANSTCRNPDKIEAHTIFLLDFSDPIENEVDRQVIKDSIRIQKDAISVGGKITLLLVTQSLYEPVYEECKPQDPKNLIRNKQWSCGVTLGGIDKSRKEESNRFCNFEADLEKITAKLNKRAEDSVLPSSPLIESIIDISSKRADFDSRKARKIILFSDLLQNTDQYSFYSGRGPQPVATEVVKKHNVDLTSVKIEIPPMQRQKSSKAKQFWLAFFRETNATIK